MVPVSSTIPYTPLASSDESLVEVAVVGEDENDDDDDEEQLVFNFPLSRNSNVNEGNPANCSQQGEDQYFLAAVLKKAIADLYVDSQLFSKDAPAMTTTTTTIDTPSRVGRKLGQGGFCQVHEYIAVPNGVGTDRTAEAVEELFDGEHSSSKASIEGIGSPISGVDKKIIKFVSCSPQQEQQVGSAAGKDAGHTSKEKEKDQHNAIGAIDLVREAHFLSVLKHPNLIRMHGMMKLQAQTSSPLDFFVVLERLDTILEDRISDDDPADDDYLSEFLLQRLQWGLEIAEVLAYLHSKRVVYRDLKLSNIGLNSDGVVKLFDLGLAKELKSNDKKGKEDRYKLSGKTGSCHTMPPEVAKGWAYNEKVDVYSFGIILWEILMSRRAFSDEDNVVLTEEEYVQRVVNGNERPPLPEERWSPELCDLLQRCWSFFPNARPTMAVVVHGMHCLLSQVREQIDRHEVMASRRRAAERRQRIVVALCLASGVILLISWYLHVHHSSKWVGTALR